MLVLRCPSEQGHNRWSVMGNYANVSPGPGVDGPWQGASGAGGGGTAAVFALRHMLTVFLQPCLH